MTFSPQGQPNAAPAAASAVKTLILSLADANLTEEDAVLLSLIAQLHQKQALLSRLLSSNVVATNIRQGKVAILQPGTTYQPNHLAMLAAWLDDLVTVGETPGGRLTHDDAMLSQTGHDISRSVAGGHGTVTREFRVAAALVRHFMSELAKAPGGAA
ncbi:hypothetical protein [Nitrospirillum viridazoti]|uniref:Uncharacterized protein n=1 Tax=Nitrospirillum viridazoti CBAmc TaxID=1441467 RepID=A0A248JT07_9PROT|nr:hypothetical protein [Nitrospirillum amazonense]ASG21374.1 hypothetical protein Y958_11460 [Nitrospirillum amazonense CBAmc]